MLTVARLAVLLAVVAAACGGSSSKPPGGSGVAPLDGRRFVSTRVTVSGAERPLVGGTRIEVAFHERSSISISAGCNTMAGTYRLDDGILQVLDTGSTAIGCDPARHAQDGWLFTFVGSKPAVTLTGNDLVLEGRDTLIQLVDRRVTDPDRPLVGTLWRLESIIAGEAVSSVPAGIEATIQLAADGSAAIHPGCNQGNARYAIDGDHIGFAEIVTTKMACAPPARDVETAVLRVLRSNSLTYTIASATLTIGGGGVGLQFRAG